MEDDEIIVPKEQAEVMLQHPMCKKENTLEKLSLADLVALRNMGYATVQKEIDKRIKEIFG